MVSRRTANPSSSVMYKQWVRVLGWFLKKMSTCRGALYDAWSVHVWAIDLGTCSLLVLGFFDKEYLLVPQDEARRNSFYSFPAPVDNYYSHNIILLEFFLSTWISTHGSHQINHGVHMLEGQKFLAHKVSFGLPSLRKKVGQKQ